MKSRTALLALLAAILVSAIGLASWSAPTVAKEAMLPAFQGMPFRPQISGDWVLAAQLSKMGDYSSVVAVNAYNLATGEVRTAFEGKCGWPQLGGNYAVWFAQKDVIQPFFAGLGDTNSRTGVSNLVVLDLANWAYDNPGLRTGTTHQYSTWGSRMAWTSMGRGEVCYSDGGKQYSISVNKPNYRPQISNGIIVWSEGKEYGNVRAYDIHKKKAFSVTDDSSVEHRDPDTDGKTIIWSQGDGQSVWSYDIATGKAKKIADGYMASIDNGVVVYLKRVGAKHFVFGKVLATNEEFQISKGGSNSPPHISGNRVVWSNSNRISWAQLDVGVKGK